MAEKIKTEYRGHGIIYSENGDEWWCSDINYTNGSLQKIKARIDKMYLDLRKRSATPAFEISNYNGPVKTEATVVEYIGEVWEGGGWNTKKPRQLVDHKIAVVAKRTGSEKASRREEKLSTLMATTPEAEAAFAEYVRLHAIAREAKKVADAAFDAIPRLTLDDVAELVRIKKTEGEAFKEGEA